MVDKKVIRNYATCLFESVGSQQHQKILEQMHLLNKILTDSMDVRFVLQSPVISKPDKMKVIKAFGKKFNFEDVLLKFFKVIIKNARFEILSAIIEEYEALLAKSKGIKSVVIETAAKLGKKELAVLQKYLEDKLQKTVNLDIIENKSLIGGVVIKYDSLLYDFSFNGAINKFEKALKGARAGV